MSSTATDSPGVWACGNRTCGAFDELAEGPGVCDGCGMPVVQPECPDWCDHRPTSRQVGVFEHIAGLGSVRLLGIDTIAIDICMEGDASAPVTPVFAHVMFDVDASDRIEDPAMLLAVAELFTTAAERLGELRNAR